MGQSIEVLKEMYSNYLTKEGETESWETFVRYNGAKRLALLCNLVTSENIAQMETIALIEWEQSLESAQ